MNEDMPRNDSKYYCRACKTFLPNGIQNSYVICPACRTVTYISKNTAEIDNNEYFNAVYGQGLRVELPDRVELFNHYLKKDMNFRKKETQYFSNLERECDKTIVNAPVSVEVGFGYGNQLVRYLERGANIFGVELSMEAVNYFKKTYPEYADRVFLTSQIDFPVDVFYANALFEHLDNVDLFIKNISRNLKKNGSLILRLPLFIGSEKDAKKLRFDINFWKPCHRTLYSPSGITQLLESYGFKIYGFGSYNYYGYRVMNTMLKRGFHSIMQIRNPVLKINGLSSNRSYKMILLKAIFEECLCKDSLLVARSGF